MTPGDIHWVDFPVADGHEQSGTRPAVILGDDAGVGKLPLIIVAPITGSVPSTRYPGTLPLLASPLNGLTKESVLLVFQLRAIDRRRIRNRMGRLDAPTLNDVHQMIDVLLGRVKPTAGSTP